MKHNDPDTVSLAPGELAKLSWEFMGKDTVVFACNISGHFVSFADEFDEKIGTVNLDEGD